MKQFIFILAIAALLFSCNQSNKEAAPPEDTPVVVQHPDTTYARFYRQITAIQTAELQQFGKVKRIMVKIISCDSMPVKQYYSEQKAELIKQIPLSSDKEKTNRAIAYLEKMIETAPEAKIYKVRFHLDALMANKVAYNEEHIKYLKEDLSEMKLVFPG